MNHMECGIIGTGACTVWDVPAMERANWGPSGRTPLPAAEREAAGWNRLWGGLKAAGGALESSVGLACGAAASWTGVGAAAGALVAMHGADTAVAGLRELWNGIPTQTITSAAGARLTGSDAAGEVLDAGAGILATAGVGGLSGIMKGERLVGKTLRWTSELGPGNGSTGPFGDMLVSRLGSQLDRAQVFFHEKVHSMFSPNAAKPLARFRASLSSFLYSRSSLLRYAEEAIAETTAQLKTMNMSGKNAVESLCTGLSFPLENGYVRAPNLALEAGASAALVSSAGRQVDSAINGR